MNRCKTRLIAMLMLASSATLAAMPATAQNDPVQQQGRQFPKAALRGEMVVLEPPVISMDGRPDRLSIGARIRDTGNHMMVSGPLVNQRLVVNYVRDNAGLVHEVWILTEEEARQGRRGLFETIFNFSSGTPAPAPDDGKTPYNQLPAYKQ